jgi:hypothetical protein
MYFVIWDCDQWAMNDNLDLAIRFSYWKPKYNICNCSLRAH